MNFLPTFLPKGNSAVDAVNEFSSSSVCTMAWPHSPDQPSRAGLLVERNTLSPMRPPSTDDSSSDLFSQLPIVADPGEVFMSTVLFPETQILEDPLDESPFYRHNPISPDFAMRGDLWWSPSTEDSTAEEAVAACTHTPTYSAPTPSDNSAEQLACYKKWQLGLPDAIVQHCEYLISQHKAGTYCHWIPELETNSDSKTPYSDIAQTRKQAKTSAANSKKGCDGAPAIRRPMNAYMAWAQAERKKFMEVNARMDNAKISAHLGKVWRSLPEDMRSPFTKHAQMLKDLHQREFPNYKYQPKKKKTAGPPKLPSADKPKKPRRSRKSKPYDRPTGPHLSMKEEPQTVPEKTVMVVVQEDAPPPVSMQVQEQIVQVEVEQRVVQLEVDPMQLGQEVWAQMLLTDFAITQDAPPPVSMQVQEKRVVQVEVEQRVVTVEVDPMQLGPEVWAQMLLTDFAITHQNETVSNVPIFPKSLAFDNLPPEGDLLEPLSVESMDQLSRQIPLPDIMPAVNVR
ncbi:hypothetical protein ACOMHN_003098 [Nucella lapillus]